MLDVALQAKLPLIRVTTNDLVYVGKVLQHIFKKEVVPFPGSANGVSKKEAIPGSSYLNKPLENTVMYLIQPQLEHLNYRDLYSVLVNKGSTLVLVNPVGDFSFAFDAGEVVVPESMVVALVSMYVKDEDEVQRISKALMGMNYREALETCQLATTKYKEFTAKSIIAMRKSFLEDVKGLYPIDTDITYYKPPEAIREWLGADGKFFSLPGNSVLDPKGLLFGGPPGTGKTQASVYIAQQLKVPLYRLDVGTSMSKYVGESEHNFLMALQQAEAYSPCVMLLDEVEKLFSVGGDDSGINNRLMSALLWWLQERRGKVLTIMTTNDVSKIPKELLRPGRIDRHINFTPMSSLADIVELAQGITHAIAEEVAPKQLQQDFGWLMGRAESIAHGMHNPGGVTQANLYQECLAMVKLWYVKKNTIDKPNS